MIRPLHPSEAAAVAEFYLDIRQDTVPPVHEVDGIKGYIESFLLARWSSFVYEENGEIVGWVDVHQGWLNQLYCKRGHTGKGIGKQMLDFAKERSPDGLQLWTFQVNMGARAFYAREGFKEAELTNGSNCEEKQPDVRLVWEPVTSSVWLSSGSLLG
jgi:GNAT superfamily N-acetyltransferase